MPTILHIISGYFKTNKAVKDRDSWCDALTKDKLLADYTIRLQHGGKQGSLDVRCYRLDEIDALEKTFEAYATPEQTWTKETLTKYLVEHHPASLEPYLRQSGHVLYRCLLGCASFPFVNESIEGDLTLDGLKRALAILAQRDAKLFSGRKLDGESFIPKRSENELLSLLFRSMAYVTILENTAAEQASFQTKDITDVLCASQPTYPKIIYLAGRQSFSATAERLQATHCYDFWMESDEVRSLIELLLSLQQSISQREPGKDQQEQESISSKAASIASSVRKEGQDKPRSNSIDFLQTVQALPNVDVILARFFEQMIQVE